METRSSVVISARCVLGKGWWLSLPLDGNCGRGIQVRGADTGDLPSGGLRGHRALVQSHLGGHNPRASGWTPPEGQWLLLPVREGQHGRYTLPTPPTREAHHLRLEPPSPVSVSPWLCDASPPVHPRIRRCPSVQKAAGQLGISYPLALAPQRLPRL